jgi:anti-sigma B factor antagonist
LSSRIEKISSAMSDTLTFREEGDVVVVDVSGKLTIGRDNTALRATLRELAEAGYRNVLLDMAGVTHIDSAGIGELMAGCASLARVNGTLKMLNLKESCVIGNTRLEPVFETYEEEAAAIVSFYSAQRREAACVITL